MKEEEKIKKACGTGDPFKVPEGYFEGFTQQLMDQLPELEETTLPSEVRITLWQRVRPWVYMAAMFCGFWFGGQCLKYHLQKHEGSYGTLVADKNAQFSSDEYLENIMDNALMDDYTIYCYLTGTENESE